MEDDTRPPEQPEDDRPDTASEDTPTPDQGGEPLPPPSRIDRLMAARDKEEKAADRWDELEEVGQPLPSQDTPPPAMTQPMIPEPPVDPEDTSSNQGTPPKGMPPVDPDAAGEAAAEPPKPRYTSPAERRGLPPMPYPHPTDDTMNTPAARAAANPPAEEAAADSPPAEPAAPPPAPPPAEPSAPAAHPLDPTPPRSSDAPTPPPGTLGDVRLDGDGMPLPRRVTQDDLWATQVGESAYHDQLNEDPGERTLPHRPVVPEDTPTSDATMPHPPVRREPEPPVPAPRAQPPAPGSERRLPSRAQLPNAAGPRPDFAQDTMPSQPPVRSSRSTEQPTVPAPRARPQASVPRRTAALPRRPAKPRKAKRRRRGFRLSWGCIPQIIGLLVVGAIVAVLVGGTGAAIYYSQVTAPSFRGIQNINDLQARSLQFQTTRILDSERNVLYQINDPNGGFRDYVTLDQVSPWVIVATISTEERDFFINPGFSIPAIVRAAIQNYREGEIVSGASTITQQLTRALLLPEEERTERSYERKLKEVFLAAELGRRFDKREVLELYLNQAYYGNLSYGIEAAAQTYFGKRARDLNLAEASFLAGLPQAPALWDPVSDRQAALIRQQQVLSLMVEAGCLDVGNTGLVLPCTTQEEINAAANDLLTVATREYQAPNIQARYPHWVVYIQQQLEALLGNAIYTSGFDVVTTLDPRVQDLAQVQVESALTALAGRNVNNASVVVTDVNTGAILAMVGSRDFHNEAIDGQVNVALTPQQPGSSIKPFTYLAAFRQGWTPASVIWDVPVEYSIPGFGTYAPVNYDGRYRGPVTVRQAIANSLNVPAVLTLDHVGVPALLQVLNDVGIDTLGDPSNPNNYGLSLTLGAGEVYLLDWTNAFATIGNGGTYREPYGIISIERDGQPVEGYPRQPDPGRQALDPGHSYLMQNILSDKVARIPSFGQNTPISPEYPAGAKTGTTNDFKDNWTMGFTTRIAVGVWVGNTDNSPMVNVTGVSGAGPIWRGVMDGAAQWYPPEEFARPPGVFPQTVCRDDGTLADGYDFCLEHAETNTDLFVQDPPGADERLYQELAVDSFTGLIANDFCNQYVEERVYLRFDNVSQLIDTRPFIRAWLLNTELGQGFLAAREIPAEWVSDEPPQEACGPDTQQPTILIDEPQEGSTQNNVVTVRGTVDAPNFSHYRVEFGVSHDPLGWGVVQGDTSQRVQNGALGRIDLSGYPDGPMTIRVMVFDTTGNMAEERAPFYLEKQEEESDDEDDD